MALSDRAGESTLSVPVLHGVAMTGYARLAPGRAADDCDVLQVPIERLDDQGLTDVRLMKVDVEGHELEVLQGGEQLLRRDVPVLLVEIEQRHLGEGRTVGDVIAWLRGLGYGASFRLGDSGWTDGAAFDPVGHQQLEAIGTRDYVSMFLFRPEGRSRLRPRDPGRRPCPPRDGPRGDRPVTTRINIGTPTQYDFALPRVRHELSRPFLPEGGGRLLDFGAGRGEHGAVR